MKQAKTTEQPSTPVQKFTLTQDGETLTFEGNESDCRKDWESEFDPTETFFDWCKNSYPYTNERGESPAEDNLSPNWKEPTPSPSTPVKDELNITPGEWIVESFGKSFQIMSGDEGERSHIATLFTATMDNKDQQPSNAQAICKAVNWTYGKGYNPAAMEELYQLLHDMSMWGKSKDGRFTYVNSDPDYFTKLKTALNNAKTIKP